MAKDGRNGSFQDKATAPSVTRGESSTTASMKTRDSDGFIFDDLFKTMSLGVIFYDRKGRVIKANPAAEMILGLSVDNIEGTSAKEQKPRVINQDGKPLPVSKLPSAVALRTGKPVRDNVIGYHNPAINQTLWLNVNAVPVFKNKMQKPYMVYVTMNDISEQTLTVQSLTESEEHYRTL
ncbi:MAG: PAS domain S-box protein, partial [Candidatus Thorarchaeota archaeon]